jgi:hypothetical protein
MTEAKWLRCEDPKRILLFVRGKVSDRKVRLCWCGCCGINRWEPGEEAIDRAVRVGERMADGFPATAEEIFEASGALRQALEHTAESANRKRTRLLEGMFCLHGDPLRMYSPFSQTNWLMFLPMQFAFWRSGGWWPKSRFQEAVIWCWIIRCVVGNPFRPVTFVTEWRTNTVVPLAHTMYDSRDFSAMPILADALQDAGCDNPDILEHCRGTGLHVRGCWVVDLVLGKE